MKHPLAAGVAATALLVVPAVATAHDATVVCDRTTGTYRVTADFPQANPTWTFPGNGTVVVRWTDGFRKVLTLPTPCVAPPPPPVEPPPVAPPPPVTPPPPPVVELPPVVVQQPPVKVTPPAKKRPPVKVSTRTTTVKRVRCFTPANAPRAYVVRRTVTTWSRGGEVLRRKVTLRRVYGAGCAVLA